MASHPARCSTEGTSLRSGSRRSWRLVPHPLLLGAGCQPSVRHANCSNPTAPSDPSPYFPLLQVPLLTRDSGAQDCKEQANECHPTSRSKGVQACRKPDNADQLRLRKLKDDIAQHLAKNCPGSSVLSRGPHVAEATATARLSDRGSRPEFPVGSARTLTADPHRTHRNRSTPRGS